MDANKQQTNLDNCLVFPANKIRNITNNFKVGKVQQKESLFFKKVCYLWLKPDVKKNQLSACWFFLDSSQATNSAIIYTIIEYKLPNWLSLCKLEQFRCDATI